MSKVLVKINLRYLTSHHILLILRLRSALRFFGGGSVGDVTAADGKHLLHSLMRIYTLFFVA